MLTKYGFVISGKKKATKILTRQNTVYIESKFFKSKSTIFNYYFDSRSDMYIFPKYCVNDDVLLSDSVSIKSTKLYKITKSLSRKSGFNFFEHQTKTLKSIQSRIQTFGGAFGSGLINFETGLGKTYTMVGLIALLSLKTAIITPKKLISQQWIEAINDFFSSDNNNEKPSIDILRSESSKIGLSDILIMTSSSASNIINNNKNSDRNNERYEQLISNYSCLIIDEVHHFGAKELNRIFFNFPVPFIFGLSATIERDDGSSNLIYPHFGPVYIMSKARKNKINFGIFNFDMIRIYASTRKTNRNKSMFNYDAFKKNIEKNEIIENTMLSTISLKNNLRYYLIVSKSTTQAERVYNKLANKYGYDSVLLVMGKTSQKVIADDALKDTNIRIIVGVYESVGEGFNVVRINALIILSPLNKSAKQLIGRTLRTEHSIPVLIYDFYVNNNISKKQINDKKKNYYTQFEDYKIKEYIQSEYLKQ